MTYPDPPPLPDPDRQDFELLFVVRIDPDVTENLGRWSAMRRDLDALLMRYATQSSTPGEQRAETVIWIYAAPRRHAGCQPTDGARVVFREEAKHLRMKYPEFLPLAARRIPTHLGHERDR